MAVRKPGLISLFDVYGTLTAPRKNCCLCYLAWSLNLEPEFTNIIDLEKARQWKVYSDSIYNMKYTIFVAFRLGLVIKHHQARSK
ncbi:hypothetical protein Sjap_013314 [Stephania japonica]|uniref:Uncharacterized protein n=1 Tax=Stephania japonica TaxID=461633 RepID=A0AAP0NXJ0_9MAGN